MSYRFRLSPIEKLEISQRTIGDNAYPLLIIDNVYQNPDSLRHFIHKQRFSDPNGKHINALASVNVSTHKLYHFIYEYYAKAWGVSGVEKMRARANVLRFHRSLPSGSGLPIRREDPHSDGKFFLAGLVYLTPDQYCKGGTGFYKYRHTGAEEKPPSVSWLRSMNVEEGVVEKLNDFNVYRAFKQSDDSDYQTFLQRIPFKTQGNQYHLSTSNDDWELTQLVPMKYNRLILYPAFVLHKAIYAEDDFDGPIEQRRLTQNFFFKYPINL